MMRRDFGHIARSDVRGAVVIVAPDDDGFDVVFVIRGGVEGEERVGGGHAIFLGSNNLDGCCD